MEGETIPRLHAGLRTFREDILRNPMAAQSVKLCVISFGPVTVQSEFALLREPLCRFPAPQPGSPAALLPLLGAPAAGRKAGVAAARPVESRVV